MRKADLKRPVEESEPPMHRDSGRDENETDQHGSGTRTKHGSGLTLDPDPRAQGGGHYFQSFGETAASEKRKYKHEHEKSSMPTRNKQKGSGKHDYRDFVAAKMRQNGGNMKAAVAEWREQSGGHMVRTDGTISAREDSKYAHEHRNTPNPAKGASASGESVASEAAAPAPKATPPAKKAAPAAKKRPPAAKKRAPHGDQSIFDGPAPDPTPPAARASAASADDGPETDDTPAARREPERNSERRLKAVQAAKDRLKANKYSGTKARFNKYWDQRTVELNRLPKQASVAADYDRYKRSVARIEEDRASARLERENREAVNRMDVERSWDRTDALPAVPRRTRQSDQDGAGMLDDIASWRNKMHKDHPFLSDMVEGGLAAGATIATGGLAEAGLGAVAGRRCWSNRCRRSSRRRCVAASD